uniref:ADP-ribosylation factor-like protein 11 isoform X4 n=1 Tax=Panthera onca TaxID=9690 RepID=UPI002953B6B5|nr:ADP-ribosylation factor-like protein 11 isoform X4 [Panthera onca]
MSLPRPRPPGKGSGKGEPATVTAFPSHLTLGTQQDEDRAAAAGCGQTATEEELFQPQSSNRDLPSGVSQDFWVPWSISATKCCCSNGQKKPFSSFLCTTGLSKSWYLNLRYAQRTPQDDDESRGSRDAKHCRGHQKPGRDKEGPPESPQTQRVASHPAA